MKKQSVVTLDDVYKEVKSVKRQVVKIEKHMVDIDSILTESDYEDLTSYKQEKKLGKLTSHEDLIKELGI